MCVKKCHAYYTLAITFQAQELMWLDDALPILAPLLPLSFR